MVHKLVGVDRNSLCLLILLVGVGPAAWCQEPAETPSDAERQMRLQAAEDHVKQVEVRLADGDKVVSRTERPLLVYGDSTRTNADGTVWAWGSEGRPLAFMETYRHTLGTAPRASVLTLTSTTLVTAKVPGGRVWQPLEAQIDLQPLPEAPVPADREATRLRQLKEQARRFTAHEFWDPDNSRFEMRLLVQPIHRYKDQSQGLVDGTVFVLAHGTNPEVLLLLEALGPSPEKARWNYSFARVGSAELHVEIDGKEVWKRDRTPGVVGRPSDPYWLFMTAGEPALSEPKTP